MDSLQSNGFPVKLQKVALSNGSQFGITQAGMPDTLFTFDRDMEVIIGNAVLGTRLLHY